MDIHFYHPDFEHYHESEFSSLINDWGFFSAGARVWIMQTCIRLALSGQTVYPVYKAPKSGIVVMHADHLHRFWHSASSTSNLVVVVARSDKAECKFADFEILQNGKFANNKNTFFIPHWPQPNLIKRDAARGQKIRKIAFKGFLSNLHPMYQDPAWLKFLSNRQLDWEVDAKEFKGTEAHYSQIKWNDYSDVDLILAVRQDLNKDYDNKPASKLVNAWSAEVPCLLGPEIAYQEIRLNDKDYIEVSSLDQTMQAIDTLIAEPELYQAIVENGKKRAIDYSTEAIVERWRALLFDVIEPSTRSPLKRAVYFVPLGKRPTVRKLLG